MAKYEIDKTNDQNLRARQPRKKKKEEERREAEKR